MLTPIFILSGLIIAILLIAKRIEEKRKKPVFILNLISRGDVHVREWHHRAVQYYSQGKERGIFVIQKKLPMYSRSSLNKALALVEEKMQKHFDSLRDSKLLKKSDGISEFFKNISEVEKGNGELHDDIYDEETQEIITPASSTPTEPVIEVSFEIESPTLSPISIESLTEERPVSTEVSKPKIKRARKPSSKRKLKVVSEETEQIF